MTASATGVIDQSAIETLRSFGGQKLVRDMSALFLEGTPTRIAAARVAASAGNADGVRRVAHSLKSSAGQLGATAMQERCGHAEGLGESSSGESLLAAVGEIETEFDAVRRPLGVLVNAG